MTEGSAQPRDARIPCPLRAAALAAPGSAAITGPGGETSYGELDRRVSAAAGRLREAGWAPGTRVALYLPGDGRCVVLLLGLVRAGCVAVPLSTRVPPQGAAELVRRAGCGALISTDDRLLAAVEDGVLRLSPGELDAGPAAGDGPGSTPADRPATIVFTSGSSGDPKAALHTFGNHYYSARGSNGNIALAPGDRWFLPLPLYHVGGLGVLFRCLLAGATVVLPDPQSPVGPEVSRHAATHASLVSTQLLRLLQEERLPESLRAVLLGGSAMSPALLDEAVRRGLPVHTSYGLTEMASQVTTTPPGSPQRALRTSGKVLPHREVSVSEEGEVLVRGETLFAGYVEGEELRRPLDRKGWFGTGDLGDLDGEGYLTVRGRRGNMFVSGGENVQPEEIEAALLRLPGVEEAVVVPVPDEVFGARPVAFVRADDRESPGHLAEGLATVLPRFKIPVRFHAWPGDMPEGMKADRRLFSGLARRLHGGSGRAGDAPG
ncbi:MAG: o-succinylbenzoate--CoA ligase [Rubrobacter sp.]|nr:o-succinylbenzoate--CoA ligase [Rubrobacter sp.]